VQVAVVLGLDGQIASVRLDLFQTTQHRIKAVGAAPDGQLAKVSAQADLGLVGGAPSGGNALMTFDPFRSGGRRGEAQVKVASASGQVA
jgi:hypothetical protein